ncbi:putative sugar transferase EpsL [Thalassocella blandensis]|nr:putative sugar transferase EpsL [Thalassocella blandensis]
MNNLMTYSNDIVNRMQSAFLLVSNRVNKVNTPVFLHQFAAIFGLLMVLPFLLLVMLFIMLESKGSPVYSQTRVGKNGKTFKLFKLRSMYRSDDYRHQLAAQMESDREGVCKKLRQDPRVTRMGKWIRKYSVDEIPQLFNVINGDMLLIGPRPALPQEVAQYDQRALRRLNVKPGLTGLWQVSGRADTTFEEQIDLDLQYVYGKSIWMDMNIAFATVPAVLFGKGAY